MYQKERALINRFVESGILNGEWTKELKVGIQKPSQSKKARDVIGSILEGCLSVCCRKIDLVCRKPGETWLLEAKLRLDPSAIGQLLTYKDLYEKTFPQDKNKIVMGLVVEKDDPLVRLTAESNNIKVFVLNDYKQ